MFIYLREGESYQFGGMENLTSTWDKININNITYLEKGDEYIDQNLYSKEINYNVYIFMRRRELSTLGDILITLIV